MSTNLNPKQHYADSTGVDLPIMKVYLAGRISGDSINECLKWRKDIINYYKDYKGRGAYPISFLCPLNSGESETVDALGLKSMIPPNLIWDKDMLSVKEADVVIANMEDFFEEKFELFNYNYNDLIKLAKKDLINLISQAQDKILNRRENIGTVMEVAWAFFLNKPVILLVPVHRQEIYRNHPFTKRASVIVTSVDELFEAKWLNILYKSIAGAVY